VLVLQDDTKIHLKTMGLDSVGVGSVQKSGFFLSATISL